MTKESTVKEFFEHTNVVDATHRDDREPLITKFIITKGL